METAAELSNDTRANGKPPGDEQELRRFFLMAPGDHEGHAQCVLKLYPGKFRYAETHGWMYYNGRYWQTENASAKVEQAITDMLIKRRELAAAAERKSLLNQCWAERRIVTGTKEQLKKCPEIVVSISDFDSDKDSINCLNGSLDLRTGELSPHSPYKLYTYCLPVAYDPLARSEDWETFLAVSMPYSQDVLDFVQLAIGYSLTGHTNEEIMFYIFGPTRSGKGTFTETILAMLGHEPIATEADFETFTAKRYGDNQNFDLAPLKPCRLVAASESNRDSQLNPAKLKQITGGNRVRCAFKRKDHFTYRPQFKIWLSSNHPVNVDVEDDAAWGRIRVISFPNSHLGFEDKHLKHRLLSVENMRGILAWAVEGAKKWYQLPDGLRTPPEITKETQVHRQGLDDIQLFIDERMHKSESAFITSADIYHQYSEWCKENGFSPKYQRRFSISLDAKGYKLDRRFVSGKQQRVILGLGLDATLI